MAVDKVINKAVRRTAPAPGSQGSEPYVTTSANWQSAQSSGGRQAGATQGMADPCSVGAGIMQRGLRRSSSRLPARERAHARNEARLSDEHRRRTVGGEDRGMSTPSPVAQQY